MERPVRPAKCQLMIYLLSMMQGQTLCWATNVGWLKVLIAILGGKEAQRSEVTWQSSHREEEPGLRSFLLPYHCHQAFLGFATDPWEQCINDLNRKLNGSLKEKSHFCIIHFSF